MTAPHPLSKGFFITEEDLEEWLDRWVDPYKEIAKEVKMWIQDHPYQKLYSATSAEQVLECKEGNPPPSPTSLACKECEVHPGLCAIWSCPKRNEIAYTVQLVELDDLIKYFSEPREWADEMMTADDVVVVLQGRKAELRQRGRNL